MARAINRSVSETAWAPAPGAVRHRVAIHRSLVESWGCQWGGKSGRRGRGMARRLQFQNASVARKQERSGRSRKARGIHLSRSL